MPNILLNAVLTRTCPSLHARLPWTAPNVGAGHVRVTQKNEASEAPAGAGASLSVLATRPTGPASRVRSAGLRPPLTPAPHATIDPQKAEESQMSEHSVGPESRHE